MELGSHYTKCYCGFMSYFVWSILLLTILKHFRNAPLIKMFEERPDFLLSISNNFAVSVRKGFLFLRLPCYCDTHLAFHITILPCRKPRRFFFTRGIISVGYNFPSRYPSRKQSTCRNQSERNGLLSTSTNSSRYIS